MSRDEEETQRTPAGTLSRREILLGSVAGWLVGTAATTVGSREAKAELAMPVAPMEGADAAEGDEFIPPNDYPLFNGINDGNR